MKAVVRFSDRVPGDLAPNRLTAALEALRAAGTAIVDLTVSNPTRVGLRYPVDLLAPLGEAGGLRYEPQPFGLAEARAAVSADYARRGLAVAAGRIALTASTSEAYSLLFKLLCDPGDRVLVPRPSYPLFEHLSRLDAIDAVPYDLEYHGVWTIDLDSVRAAAAAGARALLLVSPNNPTGSLVGREDLEAVAAICDAEGMAIVGDEVFADYPLDPDSDRVSGVLAQDRVLTFALGGLSKSVGLPQVKLGWIAAGGPAGAVTDALARLEMVADTYLSVSTPVQLAAARLLERGAVVRRQIQDRIAANYSRLHELAAAHPACRALRAEGGWSAVIQVPATRSEEALVLDLLQRRQVLAHPGYFFDFPREAFLVVSLLPPEPVFADGVARLLAEADAPAA
ncbi:MAG TPA: pyridoxal phosphate-dependent aminotransferase [Vicinamibacterales bacterium]|nr:pyridoxal phosphate-dependent aminotransferase [Vicinamibacterales bacterium]